ncbi:hypothetical protein HA466_0141330 [Hirschfeldia incana]|nr:hypothetical protein HA466_0141330 [Hirschfeldia incana]
MTSMARAPPPSRSRPPPDPPPRKPPLLGSLFLIEPMEPPDPPDPPDLSPVPALRRFMFVSPRLRLSSAVHLIIALSQCLNGIVHESLMLLGFSTSFAVASCKRGCWCRFQALWLLVLICSPPPSVMTALTPTLSHESSALPPLLHYSRNLLWPEVKKLRRAPPSLFLWTMNLLPLGKNYFDWTWCERELHTEVFLLPLDGSVKIYSSEHQGAFSPVRNPLLEDIRISLFSPQTSVNYTPPDPMCVGFFKPLAMSKDVSLSCYLPCQLYRRYGNAEDQSCKGLSSQVGVPGNIKAYQLLSYWGAHMVSLSVSIGIWPCFKMHIQRLVLLFHSEPTQDSRCIWFCQPLAMQKDYMFQCFLPCQLHHLRYGNTEELSYIGIATSYCLSGNSKAVILFIQGVQNVSFNTYLLSVLVPRNPSSSTSSLSRQCSITVPTLRCLKLESSSPSKLFFMSSFSQTSSRQGRERSFPISSLSKSSSQNHYQLLPPTRAIVIERLVLKWSLPKLEDCSPLVFCFHKRLIIFPHVQGHERSIIDDAGSSSLHSATVSFETALLTAETLALKNVMTSARQYEINALLICSDFQIFSNLVKSRRRHLEIAVLLIDTLSNLSKLVSLSLICCVLYFPKTAQHYVDVVSTLVFV